VGHRIFACDVSEAGLSALASLGITAVASKVDVADRKQLESWFKQVLTMAAHVDVLVNNVGVAGPRAEVEKVDPDEWRATLAANLDAAFVATRQVLPGMKRARTGVIINVSTASVLTIPENRAPYVVSKAALEALTLAVAREAGPYNVRCNAIRPGMMDNERLRTILQRIAAQTGKSVEEVESDGLHYVWMHKKVDMREVAESIVFLASDAARSITGQIIAVDGGMHWEE
jgi:NAD(P)-dependent dehydrogenase (short-subunit alcohol dehydrogenase family)